MPPLLIDGIEPPCAETIGGAVLADCVFAFGDVVCVVEVVVVLVCASEFTDDWRGAQAATKSVSDVAIAKTAGC